MVEPQMETVARVDARSEDAFERFFRENYSNHVRALYLLTGDRAEAEDLSQEAFARVFEHWPKVSKMDSPAGYLYRTGMNLYRSRLRRLAVRARRLTRGPAPPDATETAETRHDVLQAVAALPRAQREALVLVEFLGLGAEEAGRTLGIEASSVRGRLHRARATLREKLGGIDG